MGKRELFIAVAFVVLGFGVYRFTAPPGDPSGTGFSVSRIINELRREIRGQSASAEHTATTTHPVPGTVTEIRLTFAIGAVTIVGEARDDIEAEMHVRSTGSDTDEALRLAKASTVKFDEAGAALIVAGDFPVAGRQTPTLRLKVPARLAVRMDEKGATLDISSVASVLIGGGRGPSTLQRIAGAVTVTQRGSEITIRDVGSLRLTTTGGAEARVSGVRGDAAFDLQGGDLRAEDLRGALEVESRSAELHFDKIDQLKGPVRVNANMGEVVFIGLRADTRIDGRRTGIRVEHAGGAPLAVYSEGDDVVEITLPDTGYSVDALAKGGRVSLDTALEGVGLKVETADADGGNEESRVKGEVKGGGALVTVRATRGDVVLRGR